MCAAVFTELLSAFYVYLLPDLLRQQLSQIKWVSSKVSLLSTEFPLWVTVFRCWAPLCFGQNASNLRLTNRPESPRLGSDGLFVEKSSTCDNTGARKPTLVRRVKKLNVAQILLQLNGTSSIEVLQWLITYEQANIPGSLLCNISSVFLLFASPLLWQR